MTRLKSIMLRLAGVLLLSAATLGLRAQSISLSAESFTWEAHDGGQGLPTDKAKNIANKTRNLNKEKKAANEALHDHVNSALSQGVSSLSQVGLKEERNK